MKTRKDQLTYAVREGKARAFRSGVWQRMNPKRDGWKEITAAQFKAIMTDETDVQAGRPEAPTEVDTQQTYRRAYDRARRAESAGNIDKALEAYRVAYGVKPTSTIKARIMEMERQQAVASQPVGPQAPAPAVAKLLEQARKAQNEERYADAIDAYESAGEVSPSPEIAQKIEEIQHLMKKTKK